MPRPHSENNSSTAAALAAVRRLSFATLDATDARDIYRTLAAELYDVFGVDVHVCRVAPDGKLGHGTAFTFGPDGGEEEYVVPFDRPSGTHHVLETGKPLNVPDPKNSEIVARQMMERFSVESLLFVPMSYEKHVRSVLLLLSHLKQPFSEGQVELAYTMANQAAAGLAVLEMRTRLNARADREAALARAASALNASLDLRAVLDTLCREAAHAVGGDIAGVYLGNGTSGGVGVAAHGVPDDSDWWGHVIGPGEGVSGRTLMSGEPSISNDYQGEVNPAANDVAARVVTAASVPVRWNGVLKGALGVAFSSSRPVTQEDIEILQAIADLAGVACSNAEAFEQAQAAASTDSLTGFLNHGAIQVRIREEIWRARRDSEPFSCLLVDIDNFKPVNDRHGHLVGDEILQQVATAIASEVRPYDGVARYGGDEFVLVLPGADEIAAQVAADRLRESVAQSGRASGDLDARVTASVGVAQWAEPLSAGELLDRADRALLLAKRRGKNSTVIAGPATERELSTIEQDGPQSDVLTHFWDMVSRCERPRDVVYTLPSFLRRMLELEEVAYYEPDSDGDGSALHRLATARTPGDPGRPSFERGAIAAGPGLMERLESGPISRPSLGSLFRALDVEGPALDDGGAAGSFAAIALMRGGRLHGLLLLRHASPQFPLRGIRLAEVLAGQAMTVLLGQSGGGSRTAVTALAAAIDARDNYTLAHSEQVVELACEVARRLRLSPSEVAKVRDGALLHDVGKVAIPNEILYKAGPLTEEEWETMRTHPVIGEKILLRTPELTPIAPLVRHEHERWDGGGYPDGLAGEAIPVGSRIIFACDAYNAMITARPYRNPMSDDAARDELLRNAGTQFDPAVVDALVEVLAHRRQVA
jgi:diguanylate cyclase (GGDEF)-like protein